tara:strand:- start:1745 stop:1984 length:240 start_codon:yes stop_codon:yes gene_type:complete
MTGSPTFKGEGKYDSQLEAKDAEIERLREALDSAVTDISEKGARMDNMQAVVEAARFQERMHGACTELRKALAAQDGKK